MNVKCWLLAALLLIPLAAVEAADAPNKKPNVLFIISDDQGYSDFGFTGNKLVRTPNLDRLASQSAVFKNFVVAAACSPSRAAFFTGREHLSTGVWGVPPRANLRRDETLLPAFFKQAGYRTVHVGKADCARTLESQPWERGWDDAFLIDGAYPHRDPVITHKNGSGVVNGWTADIVTDRALEWIRAGGDEPWFASVAYIIPHLPWVVDAKYSAPFVQQGLSLPLADCYGSIVQLDEGIGRLLAGLQELGQDQRTIVAFVSDNGMTDISNDGKALSPEDWKLRDVHGLRGHKATVWENGIRVPLVVRWPGHITAGDRPQFGSAEDILPTLVDLAGISANDQPPHQPLAGVSLRSALEDPKAADNHAAVFRMAIALEGSPRATGGIIADPRALKYTDHHLTLRGPRFKFHALPGGSSALYEIAADPGEATDMQATFPQIAADMSRACRQRWDAVISSGRAFGMPTILVGENPAGTRPKLGIVPGSAAQSLAGRVRVVAQTAVGFANAGDAARYALEVTSGGRYRVMVRGQGLDACAPLAVRVGDVELKAAKTTPSLILFGDVDLQPGAATLELKANAPAEAAKPATVKDIALTKVK